MFLERGVRVKGRLSRTEFSLRHYREERLHAFALERRPEQCGGAALRPASSPLRQYMLLFVCGEEPGRGAAKGLPVVCNKGIMPLHLGFPVVEKPCSWCPSGASVRFSAPFETPCALPTRHAQSKAGLTWIIGVRTERIPRGVPSGRTRANAARTVAGIMQRALVRVVLSAETTKRK